MTDGDLDALLAAHGLSAYADRVRPYHLPCTWLTLCEPCDGAAPGSRVAGWPLLPPGYAWPLGEEGSRMNFVLQLDLAALAPLPGIALPARGLMSVFVGSISPAHGWQSLVLLTPVGASLAPRAPPGLDEAHAGELDDIFAGLAPHRLAAVRGHDFPRWASGDHVELTWDMPDALQDSYSEGFLAALDPDRAVAKLGGHVEGIGEDPRRMACSAEEPDLGRLHDQAPQRTPGLPGVAGWRNLLMVDFCRTVNLCIGDAGYLQFMGRTDALAAGDFGSLYTTLESS